MFRSQSLKLESALAELGIHGGSSFGESGKRAGEDERPTEFRTAVCCRILASLADSMGKYRNLYRRLTSEMMRSIYVGYSVPSDLFEDEDLTSQKKVKGFKDHVTRSKPSERPEPHPIDRFFESDQGIEDLKKTRFKLAPYYSKVLVKDDEILLLRNQQADLRAKVKELESELAEVYEQKAKVTRDKEAADLDAQITIVELRRTREENAELHQMLEKFSHHARM